MFNPSPRSLPATDPDRQTRLCQGRVNSGVKLRSRRVTSPAGTTAAALPGSQPIIRLRMRRWRSRRSRASPATRRGCVRCFRPPFLAAPAGLESLITKQPTAPRTCRTRSALNARGPSRPRRRRHQPPLGCARGNFASNLRPFAVIQLAGERPHLQVASPRTKAGTRSARSAQAGCSSQRAPSNNRARLHVTHRCRCACCTAGAAGRTRRGGAFPSGPVGSAAAPVPAMSDVRRGDRQDLAAL